MISVSKYVKEFSPGVPWCLYPMVVQSPLRTCHVKQIILEYNVTNVRQMSNQCLKHIKLFYSLNACVIYSELPSNNSKLSRQKLHLTLVWMGVEIVLFDWGRGVDSTHLFLRL